MAVPPRSRELGLLLGLFVAVLAGDIVVMVVFGYDLWKAALAVDFTLFIAVESVRRVISLRRPVVPTSADQGERRS
ncbi:hypothetical protein [Spirillospora sp. CA-294931]|uniref:hypothetical protein n=1 Tax=Spirillospora sp. CA-294931 TaxID=3240042 RepID=UPI003D8ACF70